MVHIPHHALLAQDMVDMLDTATGEVTRVHATVFKEAADRDKRFVLLAHKVADDAVKAAAKPVAKPAAKAAKAAKEDEE